MPFVAFGPVSPKLIAMLHETAPANTVSAKFALTARSPPTW